MNGTVRALGAGRVEIAVDQSFGNCPKYINRRLLRWHPRRESAAAPSVAERLCDRARAVVESADTLYIASSYRPDETGRKYGLDMSHRGGLPGFVEVGKDGSLAVPDYSGNSFFNTLGNILEDGRCGLLFLHFETGDIVQVAGDGEVDWPGESRDEGTVPARFLRVRPAQVRTLPGALPLSAELIDYSPHLRPGAPG